MSLFEPYTDIIRKGGRTMHYGHKINLNTGRSALVLDVVVWRATWPIVNAACSSREFRIR